MSTRSRPKLSMLLIVTILLSFFAQFGAVHASAANDDFDTLREKWKDTITGGAAYNTSDPDVAFKINFVAQTSWGTMDKSAGRTYLWADLNSATTVSHITQSYLRIKEMAIAYSTYGSSLYGDPTLKSDIIGALDWMYANRYNESLGPVDWVTWWDLEIGAPIQLVDIVLLMYDDLTATPNKMTNYMNAVEKFASDPTKLHNNDSIATGANRVWKTQIAAVRGIIVKSGTKLEAAREALSQVMDYVTTQDGFYEDGSFIQHLTYAYNGGYGANLLQDMANVLYLLNDSPWESTYAGLGHVYQWVYDSYEPLIYNGAMMDMVRGREISRSYNQDHVVGHKVMGAILRMSQSAPAADSKRMKEMVKYWIQQEGPANFYKDANMNIMLLAKNILNDANIVSRGEKVQTKVFAGMDRVVHQKPGFAFGVSMSSSRIANYESISGENLKGWYTGEGMTYLYNNNDPLQYTDYWPTVNKYRLPGTTVDTTPRADASGAGYTSPNTWTGGTALLDQYATAGMDLKAYNKTLKAKKSWFMFDDEIVALGSGINSTDGSNIETTIENRLLNKAGIMQGIDPGSPASTPTGSEPLRLKVSAVTDSGNDGTNLPQYTIDNNLDSRWSSLGDGQWIQFDLGKIQPIGYIGANFLSQTGRTTSFDVLVSDDHSVWNSVYSGSSAIVGSASQIQVFDFPDVQARYLKIVGHGNTANSWNHINELQIYAPSVSGNLVVPPTVVPLNASPATNSLETVDSDIATYWSSTGDGQSLKYDLGSNIPVGYAGISFFQGVSRQYSFDIQTSADDSVWATAYSGHSNGLTSEIQAYDFADTNARYLKLVFHGNDVDLTNKVSEVQFYGPNSLGPVLNPLHNGTKNKGDEKLVVNGVTKPAGLGWTEDMNNVSFAYLEGTGGYYFPQPANIKGSREAMQGSWAQVGAGGSSATLSKNYLTLWYDHGSNPVNKDYAYVLLPNKSEAQTAAYSANPDIEIIANTAGVQAVKDKALNIEGANFWTAGSAGDLIAFNPSSIMLKEQAGVLDVAVSDPTHLQSKVTYEIRKTGIAVIEKDPAVTVLQLSPTIKFEVNTQGKAGAAQKLSIQYDPSVTPEWPADRVTVVDELNDFTNMFYHTAKLAFDSANSTKMEGDTSRLSRTANTNEFVVYKAFTNKKMEKFAIDTWYFPGESTTDFEFYTSPDNVTYTQLTPHRVSVPGVSLSWNKVSYSSDALPAGTLYLKIVYKQNTSNVWNPQMGKVEITSISGPDAIPPVNVALNKTGITSNANAQNRTRLTDGDKNAANFVDMFTNTVNWIQIDLGENYDINDIKLWHYFLGGKTYHDVIVQVSNDSTFATKTTVFNNDADNSAGQGAGTDAEYVESSGGKDIPFAETNARYVRLWLNGSNANAYSHYVEVEVWTAEKLAQTLPAGATFAADKTAPTNADVTVTISYPNEATVKEYRLGTGGTWTPYLSPVTVSVNETVYARGSNAAGDVSEVTSYAVSNIDKVAPVTTASLSPSVPDGANGAFVGPVTLTLTGSDNASGVAKTEYSLDNGATWQLYTSAVTFDKQGQFSLIYKSTDHAGNTESAQNTSFALAATAVKIQLKDSNGNPLSGGQVKYYDNGWKDFGTTDSAGAASKSLPEKSYNFRMYYGGMNNDKTQNVGTDAVVVFRTVKVKIQLKDSHGSSLDAGMAKYYGESWQTIGDTTDGEISKELLPGAYAFRMKYEGMNNDKNQNVGTDPIVVFQTVNVKVQLKDSQGNPVDGGTAKFYGDSWKTIGDTSGGEVSKELLAGAYTFRMYYGGTFTESIHNVATNPTVVFQL
ncbi:polysaccharide lyase family 8 super-sandwich domain-containing protein [Cohnella sp. GCM10012308]|uniref:polysaccharide lyase family 8 super-sandwich domain-containing protein n=1 Tax=Cohnella sp. GCM10012308 TaxID=3317329 RepID=UPI00362140E4